MSVACINNMNTTQNKCNKRRRDWVYDREDCQREDELERQFKENCELILTRFLIESNPTDKLIQASHQRYQRYLTGLKDSELHNLISQFFVIESKKEKIEMIKTIDSHLLNSFGKDINICEYLPYIYQFNLI
jgi:hypothetical protein